MEKSVTQGCRVVVHFGNRCCYTAIVAEVHERQPNVTYELKEVFALPDAAPVLRRPQLRFWQWIASYYLCALGDVYKAALPSGLKKDFTAGTQTFVRLPDAYREDEKKLHEVFLELKRARRQEALFIRFLDLSHALHPASAREVSRKELLEGEDSGATVLGSLLKRGVLESYEKEVGRFQVPVCRLRPPNPLTPAQQEAYDAIHESFQTRNVCLLHGVTSSGKTEIYVRLIEDALNLGRQALYLLPEIAITTQITERLAKLFGDKLLVYHSKFSDNERVEVWNQLLYGNEPRVVLGVRSSLFLPFRDLGLVIVDEEHETSYKQQDPAPRYHARNAAIVLAEMHGAKTLLGSATPSIDSYYNALTGKYGLVELNTRYGECLTPEIIPVDIKELKRKKIMKDTLFSPLLVKKMETALAQGEQVILFRNRRGFAPLIECKTCGWTPRCEHCDVSLTYHKSKNLLVCHYCGYAQFPPAQCPSCENRDLRPLGFGTEKVEEEVAALFPAARTERLDMDTARTRTAYERILADFGKGKTQILIGTQMLSKGLDFGNVSVVGILNADSLMNFPDFRAHERAFQLMVQVSGRAGRRDKQGTVILQTSQPGHPLVRMVEQSDYKGMADIQLGERSRFRYPPCYRLIVIVLRCRNEAVLREMASLYTGKLQARLGERVLGPVTPVVTRVQTLHIRHIVLKIEAKAALAPVRELLKSAHREMQGHEGLKQLLIHYDVDPV
jgi:primosomal protein N' (replication factor Y)